MLFPVHIIRYHHYHISCVTVYHLVILACLICGRERNDASRFAFAVLSKSSETLGKSAYSWERGDLFISSHETGTMVIRAYALSFSDYVSLVYVIRDVIIDPHPIATIIVVNVSASGCPIQYKQSILTHCRSIDTILKMLNVRVFFDQYAKDTDSMPMLELGGSMYWEADWTKERSVNLTEKVNLGGFFSVKNDTTSNASTEFVYRDHDNGAVLNIFFCIKLVFPGYFLVPYC